MGDKNSQDFLDSILLTLKETKSSLEEHEPKIEDAKRTLNCSIQWIDQQLAECFVNEERVQIQ